MKTFTVRTCIVFNVKVFMKNIFIKVFGFCLLFSNFAFSMFEDDEPAAKRFKHDDSSENTGYVQIISSLDNCVFERSDNKDFMALNSPNQISLLYAIAANMACNGVLLDPERFPYAPSYSFEYEAACKYNFDVLISRLQSMQDIFGSDIVDGRVLFDQAHLRVMTDFSVGMEEAFARAHFLVIPEVVLPQVFSAMVYVLESLVLDNFSSLKAGNLKDTINIDSVLNYPFSLSSGQRELLGLKESLEDDVKILDCFQDYSVSDTNQKQLSAWLDLKKFQMFLKRLCSDVAAERKFAITVNRLNKHFLCYEIDLTDLYYPKIWVRDSMFFFDRFGRLSDATTLDALNSFASCLWNIFAICSEHPA